MSEGLDFVELFYLRILSVTLFGIYNNQASVIAKMYASRTYFIRFVCLYGVIGLSMYCISPPRCDEVVLETHLD